MSIILRHFNKDSSPLDSITSLTSLQEAASKFLTEISQSYPDGFFFEFVLDSKPIRVDNDESFLQILKCKNTKKIVNIFPTSFESINAYQSIIIKDSSNITPGVKPESLHHLDIPSSLFSQVPLLES